MLGMSAAVLQGLHEMRNPKQRRVIEVTEVEAKDILSQQSDETDVMIVIQMLKAGASTIVSDDVCIVLKQET
jgi:deoxyribose-phosphate aldolase